MIHRHIIVDANIARSCADPGRHKTSSDCLRLIRLLQGKNSTIGVAVTPTLAAEWKKHASRTFVAWWVSMESRGRVRHEKDQRVNDYRSSLLALTDKGVRAGMEKDAHIVEAAILHSFPVASQDDTQRRQLAALSASYTLLASIQWFNPTSATDWEDWVANHCVDPLAFRCDS